MAKGEITAQEGSFPLTRGKRGLVQILSSPRRLIPAHAGKTMPPTASLEAHRAHPRSRGENVGDFASGPGGQGSSPLTRGKRANAHRGFLTVRLIPAHAGKTVCGFSPASPAPAHPRSRGENEYVPTNGDVLEGSSPLTRGKLVVNAVITWWLRLIPAHAGKTWFVRIFAAIRRAHPRSRGENLIVDRPANPQAGSSPLTRGKLPSWTRSLLTARLIPAHAGKTSMTDRSPSKHTAHPRSRGENGAWCGRRVFSMGSSPLTRGKLAPPSGRGHHGGLIPAHAGKTTRGRGQSRSGSAHPRSRGENPWKASQAYSRGGSSPLTRGKQRPPRYEVPRRGLIPAHAGKTNREEHPF